ncbi:MAG: EAL domain-containing protein [Beijerinckiaceae bacterium]|nr:EAL domain-containing protein [Beijerinckiaceae bacterium]
MQIATSTTPICDDQKSLHREPDLAHTEHEAALSLTALNSLNRAVAVIGPENGILYKNRAFDELFGGGELSPHLRECLNSLARGTENLESCETAFDDGRTLRIETMNLPDGLLVSAEDISKRVAELAQSAEQARTDPLTLLGNRRMFRERLRDLMANLDPAQDTAAVLSIDLDRFKAINDTLGHSVGDALLRSVASRLKSVVRREDVVARLGGDEFAVIQSGGPQPNSAAALAKRLVDLLGRSYIIDGNLLNIGASVGVALIPTDGVDDDEILKNADLALYRSKQDGRRTFRFFENSMDEQMQARRCLEIDLRRALAMRELKLVYQPQITLSTKQVTGFEALLRWQCPKRGLVAPAEFMPLAEEIGVIVQIGEWMIRTACREAVGWQQPLSVSVNVSAVQIASLTLLPVIRAVLAETGLDPGRLELEITESVLMKDHAVTLDMLQEIRSLGVRVSMDDFGTGYSSLASLRSFPFHKIRIDQSFVRGDPDDPGNIAIVRAIAALGRALGMTTTAEGVDTEGQLARVIADGCTDVQGYLISGPLNPELIEDFLHLRDGRADAAAA